MKGMGLAIGDQTPADARKQLGDLPLSSLSTEEVYRWAWAFAHKDQPTNETWRERLRRPEKYIEVLMRLGVQPNMDELSTQDKYKWSWAMYEREMPPRYRKSWAARVRRSENPREILFRLGHDLRPDFSYTDSVKWAWAKYIEKFPTRFEGVWSDRAKRTERVSEVLLRLDRATPEAGFPPLSEVDTYKLAWARVEWYANNKSKLWAHRLHRSESAAEALERLAGSKPLGPPWPSQGPPWPSPMTVKHKRDQKRLNWALSVYSGDRAKTLYIQRDDLKSDRLDPDPPLTTLDTMLESSAPTNVPDSAQDATPTASVDAPSHDARKAVEDTAPVAQHVQDEVQVVSKSSVLDTRELSDNLSLGAVVGIARILGQPRSDVDQPRWDSLDDWLDLHWSGPFRVDRTLLTDGFSRIFLKEFSST